MGRFEEKIEVIAYSGYRGEETPRILLLQGKRVEVLEILNQWIEEGVENRARKRFFQVRGSGGSRYRIYYNEKTMEWFQIIKD